MTRAQEKIVRAQVNALLSAIITDAYEREEMLNLLAEDVITDIEETADWSELEDDECCLDDIQIALSRVLLDAVRFNYTGE